MGCAAVASRRAALFGRAPVAKDIELALVLFGFLGGAPDDLVAWRAPLFQAAAHHYHQQRAIVGAVPEETLRLTPADVRGRLSEWRSMLAVAARRRLSATAEPSPATVHELDGQRPRAHLRRRRRRGRTTAAPCSSCTASPRPRSRGTTSSRRWRAAGYRGLAFDQRGYSPRARPAAVDDYRIGELVADVLAVADRWGLDRFDLVGHDWGAMVAWVVAGRHPDRVRTLTAVSVPHPRAFAAGVRRLAGGVPGRASDRGRGPAPAVVVHRGLPRRRRGGRTGPARRGRLGPGLRAMFDASGLSSDTDEVRRFVASDARARGA